MEKIKNLILQKTKILIDIDMKRQKEKDQNNLFNLLKEKQNLLENKNTLTVRVNN